MHVIKYPRKECETCDGLMNCPDRVVLFDGMGSVVPPEDCPKAWEIMQKWMGKTRKNKKDDIPPTKLQTF